jgi:hypothetical protein
MPCTLCSTLVARSPTWSWRPAVEEEHGEADDDRQHVDDEQDEAEGEPAPDQREVADRPAEQLPALPPVVERHRQVLQLRVQRVAHRRLDVGARREHEPATEADHDRLDDAEPEDDGEGRPHLGAVAARQRAVDQQLEHGGDEQGDDRGGERGDGAEHDARDGRFRIGMEPHQRAERRRATLRRGRAGRGLRRHG